MAHQLLGPEKGGPELLDIVVPSCGNCVLFPIKFAMSIASKYLLPSKGWQLRHPPAANVSPRPSDVIQGGLGDCWLMAVMAAAAGKIVIQTLPSGISSVRLYNENGPQMMEVDGWVPTRRDGEPCFARVHPVDQQIWPILVEKAVARLCGSYYFLNADSASRGMAILLGFNHITVLEKRGCMRSFPCKQRWTRWSHTFVSPTAPLRKEIEAWEQGPDPNSNQNVLRQLRDWHAQRCTLVCAPPPEIPRLLNQAFVCAVLGLLGHYVGVWLPVLIWGLWWVCLIFKALCSPIIRKNGVSRITGNHVYSILRIELNVDGEFNLLKIRNPLGPGYEFHGEWGQHSPKWNLPNAPNDEDRHISDGSFWLTDKEFFQTFRNICIHRQAEQDEPAGQS